MTVEELIKELQKIKDKTKGVEANGQVFYDLVETKFYVSLRW